MAAVQKTEGLFIRVTPELKKACETAAKDAGLTLADWCRQVMSTAATDRRFALPKKGGRAKNRK